MKLDLGRKISRLQWKIAGFNYAACGASLFMLEEVFRASMEGGLTAQSACTILSSTVGAATSLGLSVAKIRDLRVLEDAYEDIECEERRRSLV